MINQNYAIIVSLNLGGMMKYFLIFASSISLLCAKELATLDYKLTLECPKSEEYDQLKSLIPDPSYKSPNMESWKQTTVEELHGLIQLIESGKIKGGNVSFGTSHDNCDHSHLESVELVFDTHALACDELDALTELRIPSEKSSFEQWVKKAITGCHLLQMMDQKQMLDASGTPIKYRLLLKGPHSEELRALKEATQSAYDSEAIERLDQMQKLEMLLYSGKVAHASITLEVGS